MIYELVHYKDGQSFNEDARRRNQMVKAQSIPLSPRLWWRVEQLFPCENGEYEVLWSRPEPLPTH